LSDLSKISVRTKTVASIAVFSALYMILRLIPTVPMIGGVGTFSASDVIAPLYGVILGPYVGGFSVFLGTFLAIALGRSVSFMFLDFLTATINAVALGLLMRRKWVPVVVLYGVLLLAFFVNPLTLLFVPLGNTNISFPFAWLHIVAFIVLLSPLGRRAGQWVETLKPAKVTWGLAILVFIGTMMQHTMGNILFEVTLNQIPVIAGQPPIIPASAYPGIWTTVFFLYPVERLVVVLVAVVIGIPLVTVLKKSLFRAEKQTS
jgi:hypothetical protein